MNFDWEAFYKLQDTDQDDALDMIYESMCTLDEFPNYEYVDAVLAQVQPEKLKICTSLGFLTATFSISRELKNYKSLFERIRQDYTSRGESPERVKSLLMGLDEEPTFRLVMKKPGP